jgi:hypothetical protein
MCHLSALHERFSIGKYLDFYPGLLYVEEIVKMGLSFCSFDFCGCGNSEGNSISFGANEKNDILVIV